VAVVLDERMLDGLRRLVAKLEVDPIDTPHGLAALSYYLRFIHDDPRWFPLGKWRTLQDVQRQLDAYAEERVTAFYHKEKFDHDD
jgi:hypothetical protein